MAACSPAGRGFEPQPEGNAGSHPGCGPPGGAVEQHGWPCPRKDKGHPVPDGRDRPHEQGRDHERVPPQAAVQLAPPGLHKTPFVLYRREPRRVHAEDPAGAGQREQRRELCVAQRRDGRAGQLNGGRGRRRQRGRRSGGTDRRSGGRDRHCGSRQRGRRNGRDHSGRGCESSGDHSGRGRESGGDHSGRGRESGGDHSGLGRERGGVAAPCGGATPYTTRHMR